MNKPTNKTWLIILAIGVVLYTGFSCVHQQYLVPDPAQNSQTSSPHESLPIKTLQTTPILIPTFTYTPTENDLKFEGCVNDKLRVGVFNSAPLFDRSNKVKENNIVQDEEGWKIEVGEVKIALKQIKSEKGYTHFSVDGTVFLITAGALVDIYFTDFVNPNNAGKIDIFTYSQMGISITGE